jgi:hypothetical protein
MSSKFALLSLLCALCVVSEVRAQQAKALAEFQRLRDLKRQAEINILTRQEVTKQSLDAKPPQE